MDDGHFPLFEFWTETLVCMSAPAKTRERGWTALFKPYSPTCQTCCFAIILEGGDTYMRMGMRCGAKAGTDFPLLGITLCNDGASPHSPLGEIVNPPALPQRLVPNTIYRAPWYKDRILKIHGLSLNFPSPPNFPLLPDPLPFTRPWQRSCPDYFPQEVLGWTNKTLRP